MTNDLALRPEESLAQIEVWADRVRSHLQKSVESVIAAGRALVMAKEELPHGSWLPMLESAGLGERQAQRLMQVAQHPILADPSRGTDLPGSLGVLRELTAAEPAQLEEWIEQGVVTPELTRQAARDLVRSAGAALGGTLDDPDEGETGAEPEKVKTGQQFAEDRDAVVFSVKQAVTRMTDAKALLERTAITVFLAQDIFRQLTELDRVRAELLELIDDEVGSLVTMPTYTPKQVITVNTATAGNAGLKVNQRDVSLGGLSDGIGDQTLTLEQYMARTGR